MIAIYFNTPDGRAYVFVHQIACVDPVPNEPNKCIVRLVNGSWYQHPDKSPEQMMTRIFEVIQSQIKSSIPQPTHEQPPGVM